jgi:predicted GNAT family N-acyltransferase
MNNNTSLYTIEILKMNDIPIVANILVESFETNPCYSLIFPKKKEKQGLYWLFKASLYLLNNLQSSTYVIRLKNSGDIIGTYSLVHPNGVTNRFVDYYNIGIIQFIWQFGFSNLFRMLRLDSLNKKILTQAMQSSTYWYLSMVVIKKEFRGTGIGSLAIKKCLQDLKESCSGISTIGLTTQLPENVTFYSRLGFEKINEGEILFLKNNYYNYTMKYQIG